MEATCGAPTQVKVDYDKLSATYDNYRWGGGPYLDILVELARSTRAKTVLEIGSGTGNNTAAFGERYRAELIGVEPSSGMIAKARAKDVRALWVRGSADAIPLRDRSVDFIFGCYVLHHLDNLEQVFSECARVLTSGYVAFVTAPLDFIDRHPMNRYFPSFARIDKARFPSEDAIRVGLEKGGFTGINSKRVTDRPRPINKYYVERVSSKFISTYNLIPEEEFEAGLRKLRADIQPIGRLDVDVVWEAMVVWGYR